MNRGCVLLLVAASLAGCHKKDETKAQAAGGPDNAAVRTMLEQFVKPGADQLALTLALKPKPEDYDAVFTPDIAARMRAAMEPVWVGTTAIHPTADQTEIGAKGATPAQLKNSSGPGHACPRGYETVADKIKPEIIVYCFRFAKPGDKSGLLMDGLVFVNGHWALFPKPWRVLKNADGAGSAAPAGSAAAP